MTENSPKLIAVYGRVSTSNQEEDGTIKTQLSSVLEYATKHNYKIVKEYTDEGWSGDTLTRPALDQLRIDAKNKIWEAVLMYDPDRLARRSAWQEVVIEELRELGIEVLFVTVPKAKNDEDVIMYKMRGVFAEYERMKIKERFRLGKLRKVNEGHILVSEPLYGYNYIPKNDTVHGFYEINEKEARVIKMIFSWIGNEGMTLRGVVKKLQELAIKPRKSKRGVWNTSTLSTLLRHEAYIGMTHWGSSYAVIPENPTNTEKYRKVKKSSRKIRPKNEWHMIAVPPIIEKDLFERTRRQLESNFALCQRNKKNEYLVAGRIFCTCGKRRGGEGPQNGKFLYYRCNDRTASFPLPHICKEKGIDARIADRLIWNKISALMSSPDLLQKQAERWFVNQNSKTTSTVGNVEEIERDIKKLKGMEDRYNKAYAESLITIEQLKEYTLPLREEINGLDLQVSKARQEKSLVSEFNLPNEEEMKRFTLEAKSTLKSKNLNFELKRAIVLNTIEKVVGNKDQLQVYGYLPITNVEYFTSDRNCWSSERRQVNAL